MVGASRADTRLAIPHAKGDTREMSGLSEEQLNEIRGEVADEPETLEDLIEIVMDLKKRVETLEEESHTATAGLVLLTDRLRKAGVIT